MKEPKQVPLDTVFRRAGNRNQLAKALGISRMSVGKWKTQVPAERVIAVEKATGIPRHRLRPDIYPVE